jgi:hypothetical protein
MKTPRYRAGLAFGCLTLFGNFAAADASAAERTSLVLANGTDQAVQVGLVLAALGGPCPAHHPPVTADQLAKKGFCSDVTESGSPPYAGKCLLTISKNSSVTFPDIPDTCISGNVTFGGYGACPDTTFPTGATTAEFTLNSKAGAETVDISLVNGYSAEVTISMSGGGAWTYGPNSTSISKISIKPLGDNVGNPGVFPKNCSDCVGLVGVPVCPGFTSDPDCQSERICNVQRSAYGGTVTITLQP